MGQKKLLIAGGGYADVPLVRAARQLGYYVLTTGNRPGDLAHRESDRYIPADFSDLNAMLDIARKERIDAICACANDFSAISAAYVAERLNLPGHDSYEITQLLHHKDRFREFCWSHKIPAPRAIGASSIESALSSMETLQFPLLVKPVDLTGGKGIGKVQNRTQAEQALKEAFAISRIKRVVVEEYLTGSRHGLSTFVREGKVVFHFADNEYYYLNPYLVSGASTPTVVPKAAIQALIGQAETIVSLLSLKTGIFHLQFILRGQEPVIIEACRRAPGDLYVELVELATGNDYAGWIVKAAAGLDCSGLSQQPVKGFFLRHCIMAERPGIFQGLTIDPFVEKRIIRRLLLAKPGDRIENHLTFKIGIAFLKFGSLGEMLDQAERMQTQIHATVAPCP